MKNGLVRVFVGIVMGIALFTTGYSQDNKIRSAAGDKYVISAKAGGVNQTDGEVIVRRADGTGGNLIKGDELNISDRVWTGENGKAEVLLNPGSFMRVGPNTAFEFLTTSLDDLRLKLGSGSAIFEVIADDDFRVTVLMPRTAMALTRSGVYRIDILPDRSSKVSVLKGKIFVGAQSKMVVKAGRSATVAGINVDVQKFDKDDQDTLATWSKGRAKELAKANASLQRNAMRNTLLNSFNRGWNLYDSFGLWIYDPSRSFWCFMPFGFGWGSPYGYTYGFDIWSVRMPRSIYTQPPPTNSFGGGTVAPDSTATSPSGTVTSPAPTSPANPRWRRGGDGDIAPMRREPAFMRMENNARANGDAVVNRGGEFRNAQPSSPGLTGIPSAAPTSAPSAAPVQRSEPSAPRDNAPRGAGGRRPVPDR